MGQRTADDIPGRLWDNLEAAGHNFTHIHSSMGQGHYICEDCGSYLIVKDNEILLFHAPPTVDANPGQCILVEGEQAKRIPLKPKLDGLREKALEALKAI